VWISKAADSVNRVVQPIGRVIYYVGLVALAAMMFLIFADVGLRYVFNRPIGGSFDLTELLMIMVVSFGFAYCAIVKGHVTVDLLMSRIPQRGRDIINVITGLLSFGLLALISWQCFLYIKVMYIKGQTTPALPIPLYPFVAVVAVGLAVFCLVLLAQFIDFLSKAVRK